MQHETNQTSAMGKVVDSNYGLELSILGQTSSRSYTRLLYCFPLPVFISHNDTQSLVHMFRLATDQLIVKWPFLGSKIRLRNPEDPAGPVELFWTRDENPLSFDEHRWFSTAGVLRFKGVEEWGEKGAPDYSKLASWGVPPSVLKDYELCHVPHEPSLEGRGGWPVYQITVNFTIGGLMICACFANSVIDSYAHGIIFEEFSKQVRGRRRPVNEMDKSVGQTQDRNKQIDMAAHAGKNIDWTKESCPEFLPPKPPLLEEPVGLAGITVSSKSRSSKSRYSKFKTSTVLGRVFSFPIKLLERRHQGLQKHISTDTAGRPEVAYQLEDMLVAWVWGSIVRARIRKEPKDTKDFSKHVPSQLAVSMNARSRLGIPDGEKYLRNAILYNCVELKSSDMLKEESTGPRMKLHRATRTLHDKTQSFDYEAIRIRLGYMSAIRKQPGSLEYQVDSADENDVIVDWLLAPGRVTYFGSFDIGGRIIELGYPEFVRELPGSDAPGRCAILPRHPDPKAPFEVYIQLDEDGMERMTTYLRVDGVHCI
ncbi:hypothetical protein BKA56DRAFT_693328 [Ilyonectria sp. MPI-CAGE-AT-0026]|nr:hypothetical protein BKA56DRAFT_693328 [Ilyonectria sp. MPI-CAGE-AT-0026]